MARLRKPLQGLTNILRFNWHFYALAGTLILLLWIANRLLGNRYGLQAALLTVVVFVPILISLLVSLYVYDLSGLYAMPWLSGMKLKEHATIVNINAGLDEFSALLKTKFPDMQLKVLDFYDPKKHTEVSIKRARRVYPAYPGTKTVNTSALPLQTGTADLIIVALSAHEIRDETERTGFFRELARMNAPGGYIVVTEHLRDMPNFLAYNIGFFHFLSRSSWISVFGNSQLKVLREMKTTPFITTFMLTNDGAAS